MSERHAEADPGDSADAVESDADAREVIDDSVMLSIQGLRHAYDTTRVLGGVDLDVGRGEVVAVLGPSGCGKTTLLRAIAGLVVPDGGCIQLGGVEVTCSHQIKVPVERRGVGLVFQDYALFPNLDVRANVAFGLTRRGRGYADDLLKAVGLADYARRKPDELSGGQQQRVALARALAPGPRVLLMDEPFANVDAALRDELGAVLRELLQRSGTSALLVTHDRQDALGLADRVAVVLPGDDGATVAQVGEPQVVYSQPVSQAVAELTGPAACWDGKGRGFEADTLLGRLPLRCDQHGACTVIARPEDLTFAPGPTGESSVENRRFLGNVMRLRCHTPAGHVLVDVPVPRAPTIGTRGTVTARHGLWAVGAG